MVEFSSSLVSIVIPSKSVSYSVGANIRTSYYYLNFLPENSKLRDHLQKKLSWLFSLELLTERNIRGISFHSDCSLFGEGFCNFSSKIQTYKKEKERRGENKKNYISLIL